MFMLSSFVKHSVSIILLGSVWSLFGHEPVYNQTLDTTPIGSEASLPFRIQIDLADFQLPNGFHSGAVGVYNGKWLFITGRTNGMHGFNSPTANFPPQTSNRVVYVVDPVLKTVASRSLNDSSSGLSQHQVDLLSVTSPQHYQKENTLYITGGYGVDSATGQFSTKDVLSAIDVPGLMHWVTDPSSGESAVQYIRQISHPLFQVTGGEMAQIKNGPTLLVFGQNFTGYYHDTSNGQYTLQVRRFNIIDNGTELSVEGKSSKPSEPDSNFRRRDYNLMNRISYHNGKPHQSLVALSGVFTPSGGIWTIPVEVSADGDTFMRKPTSKKAFKQGMNNYASAKVGLYSKHSKDMYEVLFGGITYGSYEDGSFVTSTDFPFENDVTTIKIDKHDNYSQYLMSGTYPVIESPPTAPNPGNLLRFGAGAEFMLAENMPVYENNVIKFDKLGNTPQVIGYIVGGIQSTMPNTGDIFDSSASSYIFTVKIFPIPQ